MILFVQKIKELPAFHCCDSVTKQIRAKMLETSLSLFEVTQLNTAGGGAGFFYSKIIGITYISELD